MIKMIKIYFFRLLDFFVKHFKSFFINKNGGFIKFEDPDAAMCWGNATICLD